MLMIENIVNEENISRKENESPERHTMEPSILQDVKLGFSLWGNNIGNLGYPNHLIHCLAYCQNLQTKIETIAG